MTIETPAITANGKPALYRAILPQLEALLDDEPDAIAQLANASSLLGMHLDAINWVGFYLMKGGGLVVGPFQGRPACTRIAVGRGVCGAAVARGETIVVPDVHAFPGHIACDSASRSEIVVPLRDASGLIVGVLDVDSPAPGRFDDDDRAGLEAAAAAIARAVDWRAAGC